MENETANYLIRRVICKSFSIPASYLDVSHEKLFSGQLPVKLIVGLVDKTVQNGDSKRNPFKFQHFLSRNSESAWTDNSTVRFQTAEAGILSPANTSPRIRTYFGGTNKINWDEGNDISRSNYANEYALLAYDLTPDLAENNHMNLSRQKAV
jgi:hypothetical protein